MMRRTTILVAALAVVLFAGSLSQPAIADVSFSFFYSNLSPYGTWSVSANYGRVWRPSEYAVGWNPYYDGHWVYTDYGWTWVSDYAWGAVPYHYGTWTLDPGLGWVWVPGYVWAPSWVVFSSGPDYIGWAPVPPHFVVGASIGFNAFAPERCVFVPAHSFLAPRVRGYAVSRATVPVAISRTTIVNNITVQNHVVVNRGPDPRGIERAAGYTIRPMPIARVRNATPSGRFDPVEVRADRHAGGGGALRATAPEPASRPQPARQPHASKSVQPVRQHQAAPQHQTAPRPAPTSSPQATHRSEGAHPRRQYIPSQMAAHPGQAGRPNEAHAQPQGSPSNGAPPSSGGSSAKQPAHAKPQQKPPKGNHGGG